MSQKWRIGLTAVMIIVALLAFWNTFKLWTLSDADKQAMETREPGSVLRLQQKAIRLGLDLQGGIHVVLRVKLEELEPAQRDGAVDRAIQVVRNRIDGLGVAEPMIQKEGTDRIIVDLPGYTDKERAQELIGQTALLQFKIVANMETANLYLPKIDSAIVAYRKAKGETPASTTPAQTVSDTTNKTGNDVMAELMGKGTDTAKTKSDSAKLFDYDETSVGTDNEPFSSRLSLFLSSNNNTNYPGWYVNKKDQPLIDQWLNLPQVKALIPQDLQFSWSTRSLIRDGSEKYELYLLKRKVEFLGKFLEGIRLHTQGGVGGLAVGFKLSGEPSGRFAQLTGANIDKPLAIILDDRVESAPIIRSKIRGEGQIEMGGSASFEDARNMEIVLKAGALPAPVEIIERNVVGATLGSDSIKKGFYSSLIGLLVVFLYIAFYYRVSGLIADIGLLFNVFFLMAILAGLGATLTMPGIAGIILTIGISVDSNILIFERIREELRTGKTVRAAIDAGYHRAFVAIFDSHITTLITAVALFLLGSGPIKGFAITLFWGVTLSLYTAYIITKAIFDFRKQYETLSV
jgi:protein-export membrane protein SecD